MKNFHLILISALGFTLLSCNNPNTEDVACGRTASGQYACMSEGLIGNITPKGWIKEALLRQNSGLTGHPEAMSYPYNSCLWAGNLSRNTESYGSDWWRYEQTAYYTDGLLRLGYLLDDKALIDKGEEGIEYTLEHVVDNGILGTQSKGHSESVTLKKNDKHGPIMQWPQAVFFRAMQAKYQATGDERIPQALRRHYKAFTAEQYSSWRNFINIEGMLWTYALTGDQELLQLAREIWQIGRFEVNEEVCMSDKPLFLHGVTACETLKIPMLLYAYTGEQHYLDAALHANYLIERDHLLPDGVPSSAEYLVGKNPIHSHETCDISDYTWSLGYFLMTTGEAKWADMIEKAIFNAGFGAITKDFKTLQYFSSVNQFIATGTSNNNEFKYGSTWMAYRPTHETECCAGNVHRFMPNYVARMWLRDANDGVVAALYGPNSVSFALADGIVCTIDENTDYPFGDDVQFVFNFYRNGRKLRNHDLSFSFRIPHGCELEGFEPSENGFCTLERNFRSGEVLNLKFKADVKVEKVHGGLAVSRGNLLFSYPISADIQEDTTVYANMNGKVSENPDFKCWSMTPTSQWNYAMAPLAQTCFENTDLKAYPFDTPNMTVKVNVSSFQQWPLDENRFTPEMPSEVHPVKDTTITLVPYGSTLLRLTVFPEIK